MKRKQEKRKPEKDRKTEARANTETTLAKQGLELELSDSQSRALLGSVGDPEHASAMIQQTVRLGMALAPGQNPEQIAGEVNHLNLAVSALKPTSAMEARLALQIEASSRLANRAISMAEKAAGQVGIVWFGLALKALRTSADQTLALAKLQNKMGHQTMKVEHVQVNAGGQAFVGQHIPGGSEKNAADGPHAK